MYSKLGYVWILFAMHCISSSFHNKVNTLFYGSQESIIPIYPSSFQIEACNVIYSTGLLGSIHSLKLFIEYFF